MPFGDDFVEVGGLGRGEGLEGEIIVDDEQLDRGQAAVFGFEAVVGAGRSRDTVSLAA